MFIVFEGIDGSGKTTISNRVAAALAAEGLKVKHLRAEGKFVSPVSEGIREFGRNAQNLDLDWHAEFLLYVARDVQLINEALRPALSSHDVVLADRFLYTPEVLGRYGRRLPDSFARPILAAAAGGLEPDLVILVDVDPTFARARRKLRKLTEGKTKPPSRKGLSGAGLQQRLRSGYLALAAGHPERWAVLENRDSIERSVERAVELIQGARRDGKSHALAQFRSQQPAPLSQPGPVHSPTDALRAFLAVVDGLSEREPRVAAYLLGGMHGPSIDERRQALARHSLDAVLVALQDLTDGASFELRLRACAQHPGLVLRSLGVAIDTPSGWKLWQELADRAPAEALNCLTGLGHDLAWQCRLRYFEAEPGLREAVVSSLSGLDDARAWQLRERLLEAHPGALASNYDLARSLIRSVTGLGTSRAWQLRRETRRIAPVAALSSLTGLTDAESWRWRAEALLKAPKVVMSTLRGCFDDAAWQMRRAVAFDCKEALDGLQGIDSEPAWSLREASCDVWPSTVVKTLAHLAEGERGQQLIARQLRAYPDNVSLLKHVASTALGLHRAGASVPLRSAASVVSR